MRWVGAHAGAGSWGGIGVVVDEEEASNAIVCVVMWGGRSFGLHTPKVT
jgi:hypothetical protein